MRLIKSGAKHDNLTGFHFLSRLRRPSKSMFWSSDSHQKAQVISQETYTKKSDIMQKENF
tara:strand:+ start:259 stop:438 length:180 start_codon:yes stop_codon:yes gene_type:complete